MSVSPGGAVRSVAPSAPTTWKETWRGGVASRVKDTLAGVFVVLPARSCAVMENVHVPSLSTFRVEKSPFPRLVRPETVPLSFSTGAPPSLYVHV